MTTVALGLLVGCGSSGGDTSASSDASLAERARSSLVATFTDTSFRLPPGSDDACLAERTTGAVGARGEPDIYCALTSSVMEHLLSRLDEGLGTELDAAQKSCINETVTRVEVAALLSAELGAGSDRSAVAEFDAHLAASIGTCKNQPAVG